MEVDEELRFKIVKTSLPGNPTEVFVPRKVRERLHVVPGGLVFFGKGIRLLLETPLEYFSDRKGCWDSCPMESNQKGKKDGWSLSWNGELLEITWAERMPDDKCVFRSMTIAHNSIDNGQ